MIDAMKQRWRQRLLAGSLSLALLAAPLTVRADDEPKNDARLEGYGAPVIIESSGVGLSWIVFLFLSVVALAGVFKNAKRTHLD
jgi:hypothetical protein